jgi:hypothetical protein
MIVIDDIVLGLGAHAVSKRRSYLSWIYPTGTAYRTVSRYHIDEIQAAPTYNSEGYFKLRNQAAGHCFAVFSSCQPCVNASRFLSNLNLDWLKLLPEQGEEFLNV